MIFGIIVWIVMLLLWLTGLGQLLSSVEELQKGFQSKKWFAIQARVNGYEVRPYDSGSHITRRYYRYIITCTYIINGVEHTFKGFERGGFNNGVDAELEAAQMYPVSKIVDVYYNPKKYNESVSSKGFNREMLGSFVFSFVLGSLLFNTTTGFFTVLILMNIFHVSQTEALNIAGLFFTLAGMTIIFFFCYFGYLGLEVMRIAVTNNTRSEPVASRLKQLAIGGLIFAVCMYFTWQMISEPLGLLMIGSKPSSGCYRPDFGQMKWLPTSCPQHVDH